MIKSINTIVKKKLIFTSILILVLLTNKIILSSLILLSLENWIDKKIFVNNFDISYKEKELSLNNIIVNDKDNLKNIIFKAEKIIINFNLKSLFTKLIIIENIKLKEPILNIKFDISKKKDQLIEDNLGVSSNLKSKDNPKIYPKKIIDINFLVMDSSIENFKINIERLDNNNSETLTLSNMSFKKFGNEKGYLHYKDIFKIILFELTLKITDQELKKIIKENYDPQ